MFTFQFEKVNLTGVEKENSTQLADKKPEVLTFNFGAKEKTAQNASSELPKEKAVNLAKVQNVVNLNNAVQDAPEENVNDVKTYVVEAEKAEESKVAEVETEKIDANEGERVEADNADETENAEEDKGDEREETKEVFDNVAEAETENTVQTITETETAANVDDDVKDEGVSVNYDLDFEAFCADLEASQSYAESPLARMMEPWLLCKEKQEISKSAKLFVEICKLIEPNVDLNQFVKVDFLKGPITEHCRKIGKVLASSSLSASTDEERNAVFYYAAQLEMNLRKFPVLIDEMAAKKRETLISNNLFLAWCAAAVGLIDWNTELGFVADEVSTLVMDLIGKKTDRSLSAISKGYAACLTESISDAKPFYSTLLSYHATHTLVTNFGIEFLIQLANMMLPGIPFSLLMPCSCSLFKGVMVEMTRHPDYSLICGHVIQLETGQTNAFALQGDDCEEFLRILYTAGSGALKSVSGIKMRPVKISWLPKNEWMDPFRFLGQLAKSYGCNDLVALGALLEWVRFVEESATPFSETCSLDKHNVKPLAQHLRPEQRQTVVVAIGDSLKDPNLDDYRIELLETMRRYLNSL